MPPAPTITATATATATTLPPLPQLAGKRIAFTTPPTYAPRLLHLLHHHHSLPLHLPTILISTTPSTLASLKPHTHTLPLFSAVAFPSRSSISSFSLSLPTTPPIPSTHPAPFLLSALGKDADLIADIDLPSKISTDPSKITILVPEIASPEGMVEILGDGLGRRILCPVPLVVDLEEPPVVPDFVRGLEGRGWEVVRVGAYETRWAGVTCVEELVEGGELDALVFTSTAEVEGLLKGLEVVGWSWRRVRERWRGLVVAAHGPVTKTGAERLGVGVDVVGEKFGSFNGVLEALALKWS